MKDINLRLFSEELISFSIERRRLYLLTLSLLDKDPVLINEAQVLTERSAIKVSSLSPELNNHLHFELFVKGINVNPENYYDKKLADL